MIPVNEPLLAGNEGKYLQECITSGWLSSEGPFVKRFEREFADYVGRQHGQAVANGTAALDIAVAALELQSGDEVIVPTFTIVSCVTQIVRSGLKPVFVDCEPWTWNMDVAKLEAAITPRTRAIMVVHIYGLPTDMDPVLALAAKYNLRIIEDAAEAHGLRYKGKRCGSFGDISTFSFYANKLVTTGEGGMVLTDDDELAAKCHNLRNLFFRKPRYVHDSIGWNYRMSNLQGAVGVAQLERLDETIRVKREIGAYYTEKLAELQDELQLPQVKTCYSENVYWVYPVIARWKSAVEVMAALGDKGVDTRPFFYPLHRQPFWMDAPPVGSYPVAEFAAEHGFYIPNGTRLNYTDRAWVVRSLKEVLR